jgi:hypothetical protein
MNIVQAAPHTAARTRGRRRRSADTEEKADAVFGNIDEHDVQIQARCTPAGDGR